MKKSLKEMLKELEEGGRDSKIHLNILYYLTHNYFNVRSIKNLQVEDLELLYDNLYINNELIDSDNVEYYDLNKLGISAKNQQALKEGKKILLLNYYKLGDNWPTDCKIWLDPVYDRLVY
jgi:hypothetical protein